MNALILMAAMAATGQPAEAAVVRIGSGCSGVCISADGLILTADHCGSDETVQVTFPDGSTFTAYLEHSPPQNGIDEAQAYRVKSATRLPFAALSSKPAKAGDAVWAVGYPAGNYQMNRGKVRSIGYTTRTNNGSQVRLDDSIVTDWGSDSGNSGGPLFNAAGEVVGLLSMTSDGGESYWIGLPSIVTAASKPAAIVAYRRQTVVVFTTDNCAPCERLKRDSKAGRLGEYEFLFVHWNQTLRTWSDPAMAQEFSAAADAPSGLGFPVIWVRGTNKYRVGYEPDRRGGLIGWIAGVFGSIGKMIIGEQPVPPFPPLAGSVPELEPSGLDSPPTPTPTVNPAIAAIEKLKADVLKARADVEKLKSANPLTKLKGVFALKADITTIKASAATALAEAKRTKDDAKEKPLQYLWGLFGILSGLAHRRFAA